MSEYAVPTPAGRNWTPEQFAFACNKLGRPGWSYETVARVLGRSALAVKLKLKRQGVRRPVTRFTDRTLSMRGVMRVLGLDSHHLVRGWIRRGLLKAERVPTMRLDRRLWAIYAADLVEFLQRHPGEYEASRIPAAVGGQPNPYREYARRGPVLLAAKQAAREIGVATETLRRWRREGRIPAVQGAGAGIQPQEWFYRPEVVAAARARRVKTNFGFWSVP